MRRSVGRRATVLLGALSLAGCGGEAPEQISDSGFGAFEVSLATSEDGIAIGWYDTRDGNPEIYVRVVDGVGSEGGGGDGFRLTETPEDSFEADLQSVEGGYAVAWYERDEVGELSAHLALWHPDAGLEWRRPIAAAARSSRNPVIRAHRDRIFGAWIEADASGAERVRAGWWKLDGTPDGEPLHVGPASETTWNLNAAIDESGRALVVFDTAAETEVEEIVLARIEAERVDLSRITGDDGSRSKYPDIAVDGDCVALTWFDERDGNNEVYLFVGAEADLEEGFEARARRVTDTPGDSIGAYLAWNEGRLGLSWSDDSNGSYDVYFQAFDRAGEPLSTVRRLTSTVSDSLIPAIRPWRGGFALAWNEVSSAEREPGGLHVPAARSEVMFSLVR